MPAIHPSAIISEKAKLHPSVQIGPFAIIEDNVSIGENTTIESHCRIYAGTTIGSANQIKTGAQLGCEPQDLTFTPEKSKPLLIGDNNIFKENTNISRGVKTDAGTVIGNNNYFMCGFHMGHDNIIGNNNILGANSVTAGHVTLYNNIFVSGVAAIHQFCQIGDNAMIAGCSKIVKDVPPFMTADGNPARLAGLNAVGLRRSGFSIKQRSEIKNTYKTLHKSSLNTSQALEQLEQQSNNSDVINTIINFYNRSERGVTDHR